MTDLKEGSRKMRVEFTLDNESYIVEWKHCLPSLGYKKPGTDCLILKAAENGSTICSYEVVTAGMSTLHPSDFKKYDKEVGRKISLSRALDRWIPREGRDDINAKERRKVVWDAYFARTSPSHP